MILCLSCYHSWPDSALFCGRCKRSFGGRRCRRGHLSPSAATCCLTCGSAELSVPARSLSTGLASRMIAWIVLLLIVKWTWPYVGLVLGLLLAVFDWFFGFVFGVRLSTVFASAFHLCLNLAVFTALLALFFPGFRKHLPSLGRGLAKILRLFWKLGVALLRLVFHVLSYLAQGTKHEPKRRQDSQSPRSHDR